MGDDSDALNRTRLELKLQGDDRAQRQAVLLIAPDWN